MKTRSFVRGTSLLLAIVMCVTMLAGLGTTALAASEKGMVHLNLYPVAGDSSDSSLWSHGDLTFMNGWATSAGSKLILRAIDSFTGNVCYCIEPGRPQNSGEYLYSHDESFWDNLPSTMNKTISPDEIKVLIGRIMQYGYTGTLDPNWKSQNSADADKLAHAIATQILVWETVVGERDSSFSHVDTGSCDAVYDQIGKNHPLRSRIDSYYNSIVAGVQTHTKVPSFTARTAAKAQTVSLEWDGSQYSATLTDTNNVLSNYSFTAGGLSFAKNGNKLTITAKTAPSGVVTVNADKTNSLRKGLITWSDGTWSNTEGRQDIVSYTAGVNDPVKAYLKVEVESGNVRIAKTSDDGKVAGISFTVSGDGVNETVKTDEDGNIEIKNLKPGTYTVTEQVPEGYIPQESQTVTVEAGKTATVSFSNVTVKGSVELTKVDAEYPENKLTGAEFEVYIDVDANGEFNAETDTLLGSMTEAEKGIYRMGVLEYGGYFVHEKTAPEGFVKDDGYYYFEIRNEGETVTVENEAGVGFINKPITSKLILTKKDVAGGELLPNAGFRIKDAEGNVVTEGYTDENGIAEFSLRYGKYTYEEFDAPMGYVIDSAPHEFEITEDGAVIKAEMTNKKQPDIPKTGDYGNIELCEAICVLALMIASELGFHLYRKKKEKKY